LRSLPWQFAGPVAADCEPAGPIEDELLVASVAFVGTVTQVVGGSAQFAVEEVWAGDVGHEVDVVGGGWFAPRGGMDARRTVVEDDRTWEVGDTYLVLPVPHEGLLTDNQCTATTEWRPELADLRPADALMREQLVIEARSEATTLVSIPLAPVVIGVGAMLLVAGTVIAFRRR
jgi:hypothetical protein